MNRITRVGLALALPLAVHLLLAPILGEPVHEVRAQEPPPQSRPGTLATDGDPASSELTLGQALARALEVAPRIQQWGASREAAEASAGWLTSAYLPTVTAGAALTRSRFPTIVTPIREPGTFPPLADEIREASLSVSWTVLDFGRGREGRSAARTLAEASGAREEQARMETLETVTGHFVQLALLEELEEAHRSRLAGVRENESQVRALVDEGRLPAVDRLRVAEVVLETEADLRSTREELGRVVASLSAELGLEDPLAREEIRVPPLPGELRLPPLELPSEARGPMVVGAESRLQAADHEARQAFRALLPELQVVGRQAFRSAPDLPTDRDWAIGLQLRVPLFRGDALAGVQVREARVRERAAELEAARTSLEAALRDLRALERDARERIGVLDARVGHLEEVHRIDVASYQEGRTTLAELLATEARLAGARAERIGLTGTVLLAHLRTASLTGELSVATARHLLGDER
jgi:outer membrane protein TolC